MDHYLGSRKRKKYFDKYSKSKFQTFFFFKKNIGIDIQRSQLYCSKCLDYIYDRDFDNLVKEEKMSAREAVLSSAGNHLLLILFLNDNKNLC